MSRSATLFPRQKFERDLARLVITISRPVTLLLDGDTRAGHVWNQLLFDRDGALGGVYYGVTIPEIGTYPIPTVLFLLLI